MGWDGDYRQHSHTSRKNIVNLILCIVVAIPSIYVTRYLFTSGECRIRLGKFERDRLAFYPQDWSTLFSQLLQLDLTAWCQTAIYYPIIFTNILFFLNVSVLFWIIGLIQRSFWLIDPYWTIIPPMVGLFYHYHPLSLDNNNNNDTGTLLLGDYSKGLIMNILVLIWSLRLTYNYFRREEWKFGQREDWRYTKMQKEMNPYVWYTVSFFAVGLAQQPMLMGITLPFYSGYFKKISVPFIDIAGIFFGLIGIAIAHFADTQLEDFMKQNRLLKAKNQPIQKLLYSGLWVYSRHPNYFGEQLWWWSFSFFSISVGQGYFILGTFFNSIILGVVTIMTENKMLKNWTPERRKIYKLYQRSTSVLFPLPPSNNEYLIQALQPEKKD